MASKNPVAVLVDMFSDEFGGMAGPIVDDIKAGLAAKKNVRTAVEQALAQHNLTAKIKESVLEKMVTAAAIGFGIDPKLVVDPVGIRKTFLNATWPGDGLKLSQRIAAEEHKQIIIDTVSAQMSKARSWAETAEALSNPLKIGGGPNYVKADITKRITDLAAAAKKVGAGSPEDLKDFRRKMKAARRHVERLSLRGAPNQTLKAIYTEVITAAEDLNEKALDQAMQQAVRDKARYNAERIARTEIARAYGEGFATRSLADTDVIGRRSVLSTRHPEPDICNFHAQADLYDMGPGVTPKHLFPPYPYHPHCLCILVEVYEGEVEPGAFDEKKAVAFLSKLPSETRKHLLGAEGAEAFAKDPAAWKGHLKGWQGHKDLSPLLKPEQFVKPGAALEAALAADKAVEAKTILQAKALTQDRVKAARGKAAKLIAGDTPLDVRDFRKVGEQAGSNPGGFYKNGAGERWYLKQMDGDRARNELLAGKLYTLLGIDTPEVRLVDMGGGKLGLGSRIIDGLRGDQAALTGGRVKGVAEGFGADAWLANWDVVGLGYDNLMVKGTGKAAKAFRVDTGGALKYRARGDLKGSAFGEEVSEVRTFLDGSNPQSANVFRNYSKEDLAAGMEKVAKLKDADIRKLVLHFGPGSEAEKKELARLLIARKKWLQAYLEAETKKTAAAATTTQITDLEVQKIRESRLNGFAIPSDKDHIEDQQILFWKERNLNKVEQTAAILKVRGKGLEAVQALVRKSKAAGPQTIADDAIGDKVVTALKGIASRAAKGQALEAKDLQRVKEAAEAFKATGARLLEAVEEGVFDQGVVDEWIAHHQPWLDTLEAAVAPGAGAQPAWKPISGGLFQPFKLPPLRPKTAADEGISFVRKESRFTEKEVRRGNAVEGSKVVWSETYHYEATVRGATIRYWDDAEGTPFALRGRLEVFVPGEGVQQVEKVYQVLGDLGVNNKLATVLDREELYLTQVAYHMRENFNGFRSTVAAIPDQALRVARMKELLSGYIGKDVTNLKGYNALGTYQAFGQGRLQLFRPDLEGKAWDEFQEEYVLHHKLYEGIDTVLESILNSGGHMAPTAEKLRRGIPLRGMSPTADLDTGGASYFFTRIQAKSIGTRQPGLVWNSKLVSRLDAISYESDEFGRTTGDHVLKNRKTGVKEWVDASKRSRNETIFKNSLSLFDDLRHIVVSTKSDQERVLKVFRSHGYDKWPDGRGLEEVVIVAR